MPSRPRTTPVPRRPPAGDGRRARLRPGRTSNVFYGKFRAVRDVNLQVRANQITAFIGPSGCGKTTVLRCLNRMNDLIPSARIEGKIRYHGARPLRPGGRRGRGPPAHRHGVPEAQPVPQVDLRQRRLRPPHRQHEGQPRRHRRAVAAQGGPVGRGQGPAQDAGHRDLRRPAAAAVHRPGHRHPARGHPDGRALLGPRPDRHHPHRGPDAGAQGRLHDRHRHPQHAAGGPGERHDRLLHRRGEPRVRHPHRRAGRVRRHPDASSPPPATTAPRPTSPAGSADARSHA